MEQKKKLQNLLKETERQLGAALYRGAGMFGAPGASEDIKRLESQIRSIKKQLVLNEKK